MKNSFRQSMSWLHTWTGLVFGSLLYFIFLTGTLGYFDIEIDRWMQPELPQATRSGTLDATSAALHFLNRQAADANQWYIELPTHRDAPYLDVAWRADGPWQDQLLNASDGTPLVTPRATGGGQLLYRMHWRLHYLPSLPATLLVGFATLVMLIGLVTGIIVHKKIFADFFTFRPGKGQRSWLDAHNISGVMALPFHLMITYSGLLFFATTLMPFIIHAHYGEDEGGINGFYEDFLQQSEMPARSGQPQPLTNLAPLLEQAEARWGEGNIRSIVVYLPGDANAEVHLGQLANSPLRSNESLRFSGTSGELLEWQPASRFYTQAVSEVFLGLHEGLFAGPVLRWLYFGSGLLGSAMIATGLVLWTRKRQQKLARKGSADHRGLRLVEHLNVGIILGLPCAIALYFWANRLLPVGFAGRADWEAHILFISWAALLLHPFVRPLPRAWIEQTWLAAAAFGLLPLLNALTTDQHLLYALPAGDLAMAGFDLTALASGGGFALLAIYLSRKAARKAALLQNPTPDTRLRGLP